MHELHINNKTTENNAEASSLNKKDRCIRNLDFIGMANCNRSRVQGSFVPGQGSFKNIIKGQAQGPAPTHIRCDEPRVSFFDQAVKFSGIP